MEIITPLISKVSEPVKNWKEIKQEASALREFIRSKNFKGHYRDAFAISHVQVSNEPKKFFVLSDDSMKFFGSWCVVNLKITRKKDPCTYPEACMSFMYRKPKRINRFADISVRYQVPFLNLFLIPRWKRLKDLPAFIAQHEDDHSNGINIYGI